MQKRKKGSIILPWSPLFDCQISPLQSTSCLDTLVRISDETAVDNDIPVDATLFFSIEAALKQW